MIREIKTVQAESRGSNAYYAEAPPVFAICAQRNAVIQW